MKDTAVHGSSKPTRNSFYTKKRPSPHGVSKTRKTSSLLPASSCDTARKTPVQQRLRTDGHVQREAQAAALKRDGHLLEDEYRAEVMKYMHDMEQLTMSSASSIDHQPEIQWNMRPFLVDFLVEIHLMFKLRPETLYLTLNIIDRYCSRRVVYVKHYQLVGCAALWIAAKFEDAKERVPTVQDLHELCRQTYDFAAFIQMEYHVLTTIQWMIGHPTAEAWLRIACCGMYMEDQRTGHVARFLMEITLFHREFIPYTPSATSRGALSLAQCICDKPRRFIEESDEVLGVAELLDDQLANHLNDVSEILLKKYGYAFYSKASNIVVDFYLSHKRFVRHPVPDFPLMTPTTPLRNGLSPLSGIPPTPLSASTSCSSISSDDMPVTPTKGSFSSSDPFTFSSSPDGQKENARPTNASSLAEAHVKRPSLDGSNDFLPFSRPALQSLNGVNQSPRTMVY